MRKSIILALGIALLLIEVGLMRYQLPTSNMQPCLLPSVDAGFVEQSPVVCVNTGVLATSKEIQTGNYYQEECKPGMPVPCATVYLLLFVGDKPTSKVTTDIPQVADYFMQQGYVPVPKEYYDSTALDS